MVLLSVAVDPPQQQSPVANSPDSIPPPVYEQISEHRTEIPVQSVPPPQPDTDADQAPEANSGEQGGDQSPAQTYETREIQSSTHSRQVIQSDSHTEVRVKETKEVTLEEVQTSETIRHVTSSDFSGIADIQEGEISSKEVKVNEYSRVEVTNSKVVDGEKTTEESVSEQTKHEEIIEGPTINTDIIIDGQPIVIETQQEEPIVEEPPSPAPQTQEVEQEPTQDVKVELAEADSQAEESKPEEPKAPEVEVEAQTAAEEEPVQVQEAPKSPPQKSRGIFSGGGPTDAKGFFAGLFSRSSNKDKDKEEKKDEKKEEAPAAEELAAEEDKKESPREETPKKKKRGLLKKFSSKTSKDKKQAEKKAAREAEDGDQSSPGTEPATPDLDRADRVDTEPEPELEKIEVAHQAAHIESASPPLEAVVTQEVEAPALPPQEEISYPIETEVLVQGDEKQAEEPAAPSTPTEDMSVTTPDGSQVDHREILITSDRPKALTLPKEAKKKATDPEPGTSNTLKAKKQSPDTSFDNAITAVNSSRTAAEFSLTDPSRPPGHFVIVAIDFGTTFSGYAFSFTRDADSIHMMRKWEGGDSGVINQKTPTALLLTPDGKFHSFGFSARDFFHDLDPQEAKKWLYFEKFKMALHYSTVSVALLSCIYYTCLVLLGLCV